MEEASATGRISGDSEAGLTVRTADSTTGCESRVACVVCFTSCEPKSSWEKVTGGGEENCSEWRGEETLVRRPVNCSSSRWSIRFLASISASRSSRSRFLCSTACFAASKASTSNRLRSLEDWAARRLRRTRSTRLCSFSSSVFARFLGRKCQLVMH